MAGKKGQSLTCPGRAAKPFQRPCATIDNLIEIIQTIEAFVNNTDWPKRARDVQKHIKTTTFSKVDQNIFNISKDIQELKAQVKGLTELVKGIAKQLVASALYTDAFRSKGSSPADRKPDGQCIQTILAYRARELVVALGTEIAT